MENAGVIWMDGEQVAWEDATVHVLTHALNHGTAVFEGIRCYETPDGPAVFRLRDHVRRLFRSARILMMDVPYGEDELASAVKGLVSANGFGACYFRMLAYRGFKEMGVNPDLSPVAVVAAGWRQAPSFADDRYANGLRTTISSWRKTDPNSISPQAKTTGAYVTACLARAEAARKGYDEAILLNADGKLAEAAIENIFLVRDQVLLTPPIIDGVLPGITRQSVMQLAADAGIECRECSLSRADLYTADEAFLTGTGAEIVSIREVDERVLGDPGPLTRDIQERYAAAAGGRDARYRSWLDPVEG